MIDKLHEAQQEILDRHHWQLCLNHDRKPVWVSPVHYTAEGVYYSITLLRDELFRVTYCNGCYEDASLIRKALEIFRDAEVAHLAAHPELQNIGARFTFDPYMKFAGCFDEAPCSPRSKAISDCAPGSMKLMSPKDRESFLKNLKKMGIDIDNIHDPDTDPVTHELFEEARQRIADWESQTGIILKSHSHNGETISIFDNTSPHKVTTSDSPKCPKIDF